MAEFLTICWDAFHASSFSRPLKSCLAKKHVPPFGASLKVMSARGSRKGTIYASQPVSVFPCPQSSACPLFAMASACSQQRTTLPRFTLNCGIFGSGSSGKDSLLLLNPARCLADYSKRRLCAITYIQGASCGEWSIFATFSARRWTARCARATAVLHKVWVCTKVISWMTCTATVAIGGSLLRVWRSQDGQKWHKEMVAVEW